MIKSEKYSSTRMVKNTYSKILNLAFGNEITFQNWQFGTSKSCGPLTNSRKKLGQKWPYQ